ncbi:MAG: hypothetical protein IT385_06605 [Deltaproteobacteria bacterium]|nr:hypothetical protein [Deltaproteobacteria bacterium]
MGKLHGVMLGWCALGVIGCETGWQPGSGPSGEAPDDTTTDGSEPDSAELAFVPEPVPELAPTGTDQPVYVFLFTHTEDPFNHALSEARYTTTAPILEALAADYPDTHPEWTIQLQGSDAKTIADRHGAGGLVAYLQGLAASGRVHFGYHGQHDPTYTNRPQKDLVAGASFGAIAEAFDDWVSCERDLATGECVIADAGGVVAIQDHFGPIEIYSGLAAGDEGTGPFEDGGGHWAVRRFAPEVRLAFGFSDHAPEVPDYERLVTELMTILSPSGETSGGVFWAEDALRINDGDWQIDVHLSNVDDGARAIEARLSGIDTSRPRVMNGGIASKWIYADTSPTQWGYAHPTSPTLRPMDTKSAAEITRGYANMEEGLRWLAGTFMPAHPGSRFIGPDELLAIAAPPDHLEVTADELDVIARWALTTWTDRPPSWLSDGVWFYSLRDAIGLLARALAEAELPASQTMTRLYGPEQALDATAAVRLSAAEVRTLAATIAGVAAADVDGDPESWTPTPPRLLASSYMIGGKSVTVAQALYALATVYAARHAGAPVSFVRLPATAAMPETFDIYRALGCISCEDTAWSTKPARLGPL